MTKKFTEEQYQEIINFEDFEVVYRLGIVDSFVGEIIPFIDNNELQQEAMALANPLTREWAHDKFVEKEKKYYWSTKKKSKKGKPMNLLKSAGGIAQVIGQKHALTETEIREWGYNPDMFDKEEVD